MKVKFGFLDTSGTGRYGGQIGEAEIIEWNKKVGDHISKDELIGKAETDKATVDIEAPVSGILVSLEYEKGEVWREGKSEETPYGTLHGPALGLIETDETLPVREKPKTKQPRAVPAARELARKEGVELEQVRGRAEGGLIKLADVESVVPKVVEQEMPNAPETRQHIVSASMLQRSMAEHMERSQREIPHAGDSKTINITSLVAYREHAKALWQKLTGSKLRYDHFFLYFAAQHLTIGNFRVLNAYWDKENKTIVENDDVNLGLAVETPKGLVVVVVREAQKLNFLELMKATEEKIARAKAGKLTLEDVTDLTFTIDNSGRLGGENPNPIIPFIKEMSGKERPTCMIIALSEIFVEGSASKIRVVARFDHRLTDGLAPMKFVLKMKEYFEEIKNPDEWTKVLFEN